jgi:hypothetical protein
MRSISPRSGAAISTWLCRVDFRWVWLADPKLGDNHMFDKQDKSATTNGVFDELIWR